MTPDVGTPEWLIAATEITRRHIRTRWGARSCVASTRIGIEVWRHYGIPAEPLAVAVCAFTEDAYAWLDAHPDATGPPPVGHGVGVHGTGAVTGRPGNGEWDGHLILTHPGWLIDLSADQLSRPDRGLHVPGPIVAAIEQPLEMVPADTWAEFHPPGARLMYRPMTGVSSRGWRDANDWRFRGRHRAVAGAAIREIRDMAVAVSR